MIRLFFFLSFKLLCKRFSAHWLHESFVCMDMYQSLRFQSPIYCDVSVCVYCDVYDDVDTIQMKRLLGNAQIQTIFSHSQTFFFPSSNILWMHLSICYVCRNGNTHAMVSTIISAAILCWLRKREMNIYKDSKKISNGYFLVSIVFRLLIDIFSKF